MFSFVWVSKALLGAVPCCCSLPMRAALWCLPSRLPERFPRPDWPCLYLAYSTHNSIIPAAAPAASRPCTQTNRFRPARSHHGPCSWRDLSQQLLFTGILQPRLALCRGAAQLHARGPGSQPAACTRVCAHVERDGGTTTRERC